jgi:hypothetical protein
VKHQNIGILYVELYLGDVTHAEQALARPELHQVLASTSLLLLSLGLLLGFLGKDAVAPGKDRLQTLCREFS